MTHYMKNGKYDESQDLNPDFAIGYSWYKLIL